MFNPNHEEWRPAAGYEDFYEVSSFGNVRRKGVKRNMKPSVNNHGYLQTIFHTSGRAKCVKIHRLVATTFLPGSGVVNHLDGVKTNNVISNLEITSQSENVLHAYKSGLKKPAITTMPGRKNGNFKGAVIAKNIESGVEIIMEGRASFKANGFQPSGVYRCLNGKSEKYLGHTFVRIAANSERSYGRTSA
ncbi:TPA: NUMOD4 domain-containing protein [Escherichia coli]